MRSLFPYVAVLMVYLMTPGAGEIVENVVHLAMSGHTAHAIEDEDHEPTGDEHGCSGSFHVCQCHSSALFMVGTQRADVASEAHATDRLPWGAEDARADGYLSGLFRPPIA